MNFIFYFYSLIYDISLFRKISDVLLDFKCILSNVILNLLYFILIKLAVNNLSCFKYLFKYKLRIIYANQQFLTLLDSVDIMENTSLLKDYATTLQRQIQSKNQQLRTLTQENQKLFKQNQQSSMKRSNVLNTSSVCIECKKTKNQLNDMQTLCNQLQLKYDSLQRETNIDSPNSTSARLFSNTCGECSRIKRQNEDLKAKLNNFQKDSSQISASRVYSAVACTDCSKTRSQIKAKDEFILKLRSQISQYNSKILTLQGQIHTLNVTASQPVFYTQNVDRQNDLQRVTYLNGQVEQYIALVNSLRSQIYQKNQENQRYIRRILQHQSRPTQIQYIQRQYSPQILQQIRNLKIQIGQLSNQNILFARENATLKSGVMNRPRISRQSNVRLQPSNLYPVNLYQDRHGRHFRKSGSAKRGYQSNFIQQKLPFSHKHMFQGQQIKAGMSQMQNEYLKGTLYSQI